MSYHGSCHCEAVKFTVDADPPHQAMSCNCSHCRRKGFLMAFVPGDTLTVSQGEDALTEYRFYKHDIAHLFCAICGCQPVGRGKSPDGRDIAMINLRCVPDIDLDALEITRVDGASF